MNLIYPLENIKVSSHFGLRVAPISGASTNHNGTDFSAPIGTPVYAPANGVVKSIYNSGSGGKQMVIEHSDTIKTGYAHLNDWKVSQGDKVKKGQHIADVGNTGNSTGPHLHFTVTVDGQKVDPMTVLKKPTKWKEISLVVLGLLSIALAIYFLIKLNK